MNGKDNSVLTLVLTMISQSKLISKLDCAKNVTVLLAFNPNPTANPICNPNPKLNLNPNSNPKTKSTIISNMDGKTEVRF